MAGQEHVQVKVLKCAFEDYSGVIFESHATSMAARFHADCGICAAKILSINAKLAAGKAVFVRAADDRKTLSIR